MVAGQLIEIGSRHYGRCRRNCFTPNALKSVFEELRPVKEFWGTTIAILRTVLDANASQQPATIFTCHMVRFGYSSMEIGHVWKYLWQHNRWHWDCFKKCLGLDKVCAKNNNRIISYETLLLIFIHNSEFLETFWTVLSTHGPVCIFLPPVLSQHSHWRYVRVPKFRLYSWFNSMHIYFHDCSRTSWYSV